MAQVRRMGSLWLCYGAVGLMAGGAGGPALAAQALPDVQEQLRQVKQQNDALQQQLLRQQEMIDELNRKVATLTSSPTDAAPATSSAPTKGFSLGKVRLSGEGGAGFFHSQSEGQFPNSEFRIDEAKLFVEAPIWGEVYFFGELNLFSREALNDYVMYAGEVFLDVENISRLWNQEGQFNLRLGRFDIPIGEEYLRRDAIDNPLVSHSIMDLWGVDEGVAFYGSFKGKLHYIAAVQNGGSNGTRDFDGDKSVAVRIGYDPIKPLHLSVSAMRTGELDAADDRTSELWLGSGLIRSLGSAATTSFEADVLQGDVELKLATSTVRASGGVLRYDDNDPGVNNRREVYYYAVEAIQRIYRGAYAAARWSQVFANDGFLIVGNGDRDTFYRSGTLTEDLWLLSLGLGYRWSDQLVLKAEYSFSHGHLANGGERDDENLVAALVAFAF